MAAAPGASGSLVILSSSGETGRKPAHATGTVNINIQHKSNGIKYLPKEWDDILRPGSVRDKNPCLRSSLNAVRGRVRGTGRSSCKASMLPPPKLPCPLKPEFGHSGLTFEYIRK